MPSEATPAPPPTADQLILQADSRLAEHRPASTSNGSPAETPTPATAVEEQESERAKQYEFIESGSNIDLKLSPETQQKVVERLLKRRQVAGELATQERPLSVIDRVLLNLGPDTIKRLEAGQLTKEDLGLSWFVLHNEMLEKALSVARLIGENPGRFHNLRNIPLIGRLAEGPQTQLADITKRLTSEYTREIGFDTWDETRIINHLTELNQLRLNIEQSLFERGFRDPLFEQVSTAVTPMEFGRKTGNRLHDAVANELIGPEGILTQRYDGRTLLELEQQDPVAAIQAVHEASQRGLTKFARITAESLLYSEKPEADLATIEQQAKKLEEPPKPEDITPFREAVTKTSGELTQTETRLTALKTQAESTKQELPKLEQAFLKDQASYKKQEAGLNSEIGSLEGQVTAWEGRVPPPLLPGATAAQQASYAESLATISRNITTLRQLLSGKTDTRNRLLGAYASSEAVFKQQQKQVRNLEQAINNIETAGGELESKQKAKETAEKALKTKQDEATKGGSPENQKKAGALRQWAKVAGGYEKIMDARFSQERGDEFSRERLASITERADGQVDGAERLREHIFQLVNKAGYDPELARKMLSDETLARAIIWSFQLDTKDPIYEGGHSLGSLLAQLKTSKDALAATPTRNTRVIEARQKEVREKEKALIKTVLPHLRRSQFEVGDLIRFIAQEGIKSAENGNPYLELTNYYRETQPALKLEAESILRPGTGQAILENHQLRWEGEIIKRWESEATTGMELGSSLPLRFRVIEDFDRDRVQFDVDIEVNQRLLETLPNDRVAAVVVGLPEPLQNIFYDDQGRLRTEIRGMDLTNLRRLFAERGRTITGQIPGWVRLNHREAQVDVDNGMDSLNTILGPTAASMIDSAVADHILHLPNQARLALLRGLNSPIRINNVPVTESTTGARKNYELNYNNNGEILITDLSDPQRTEVRLYDFYNRRLSQYTTSLGVHTLNPEERQDLQAELLSIQAALGREILRAQQRR